MVDRFFSFTSYWWIDYFHSLLIGGQIIFTHLLLVDRFKILFTHLLLVNRLYLFTSYWWIDYIHSLPTSTACTSGSPGPL